MPERRLRLRRVHELEMVERRVGDGAAHEDAAEGCCCATGGRIELMARLLRLTMTM